MFAWLKLGGRRIPLPVGVVRLNEDQYVVNGGITKEPYTLSYRCHGKVYVSSGAINFCVNILAGDDLPRRLALLTIASYILYDESWFHNNAKPDHVPFRLKEMYEKLGVTCWQYLYQ
jgi:hypothetical protein